MKIARFALNQLQNSFGRDKARPSIAKIGRFPRILEGHVLSWPSFHGVLQRTPLTAVLWIGLLAATRGAVDTHYVAQCGQTPLAAYTNWTTAASNIQDAINVATANDTVLVSNGVYQTGGVTNYPAGSLLTNRVAITNAVTVKSANNDPTNTIIKGRFDAGEPGAAGTVTNGSAAVRCVYMMTNGASLIGFMLTNGATLSSGSVNGGGVYCDSTSQIISNCVITGNAASFTAGSGGGAYYGTLYNCQLAYNFAFLGAGVQGGTQYNCTLIGNQAKEEGGGANQSTLLYNCTVISNYSGNRGGGVFRCKSLYNCLIAYNSAGNEIVGDESGQGGVSNCTIICNSGRGGRGAVYGCILYNCTVISNSSATGGGGGTTYGTNYNCLIAYNSATNSQGGGAYGGWLYNCTVVSNLAKNGGGVVACKEVCNSIIYFNTSTGSGSNWYDDGSSTMGFTNSCTWPTPSGARISWPVGNITNDPQLVNKNTGIFRLSNASQCVNTGTNFPWMTGSVDTRSKDLDGYRRLDKFSGRPDMGCYEYIPAFTIYNFH